MKEYARLVVSVDSTQVTKAGTELDKLPAKAGKAEKSASSMSKAFVKLGSVLAAAFSVREVMRAAESYTNLTNRLRLVTEGAEGLARAQEDVFRIAQASRQPLSETAELYQRIAQNQKELGLTSEEVGRITETISKSLAVSGTSAASAAGAMVQLGQAFASGALRGDELNSVLESAPALAQALAKGLGVTVGQLRALGQEGSLTAKNVVEALQAQGEEMDKAFESLAPTISSALTTVSSAFTQMIGKMDSASGSSSGLAEALMEVAKLLQDPDTIEGLSDLASGLATLTTWLIKTTSATASFFDEFTDRMAGIRNLTEIQRMQEEVRGLQIEINNLTGDLSSPDWLLSIRGLDRGELESKAASLKLMIQGLDGTLQEMRAEPVFSEIAKEIQSVIKPLGAVAAVTSDVDKEAKKLAGSYKSAAEALERQIALYGLTSEAAATLYELENGSLQGIVGKQATYLLGLAKELDEKRELTEIEQLRIDILRESGQLRAANDAQFDLEYAAKIAEYEKQGNQAMIERLETLRAIREIQMTADQPPGTVEGVSSAPPVSGADPAVGGAGAEIMRLQMEAEAVEMWRSTELEKQRAFLEAKAINEEQYAERTANIHEQHQQKLEQLESAKNQTILTSSADFFGNMATLSQSGNKELGAIGKAAAIAQATMQGYVAVSNALAVQPYPLGLALAASAGVVAAANVASIAGVSFEGGGYTGDGPRVGGLDGKGGYMAMVHPKETIIDHTKQSANGGSSSPEIQIQVSNNGQPKQVDARMQRINDKKFVLSVMMEDLASGSKASYSHQNANAHGMKRRGG